MKIHYIRAMDKSLISILMPFKNTEGFLRECLDSVVNQSYNQWELVTVDDGSIDGSYELVKEYTKKDTRIKLFKNDGEGIISALQKAFKNCNGDYITRMDSDDIMDENKLFIMLNNLLQYGKNHVAVGLVKYFSAEGISNGYARYESWLNTLTKTGTNYSEIYKECVIPSPCWMIGREDFETCDGFNPNRYPEDYDLTFRFYKYNYTCIPCDVILHHWRDYSARTSRTHEHYAQNYFLDIKLYYFLELEYDISRPLTIWGAGTKGKSIAKSLVEKQIPFFWICDNNKKIGKHIYAQELLNFEYLKQIKNPQCIVTVANEAAQSDIRSYFENYKMQSMIDYFFFC
jgi:glycosyltransferase involved in cell wall biosynthesis